MKTVAISGNNRITIPSEVRKKLGVRSGDRLIIDRATDKEIVLKKESSLDDIIAHYGGMITVKTTAWNQAGVDAAMWIRKQRDNW